MKVSFSLDRSGTRITFNDDQGTVWIIPLKTMSMKMRIINEEEGEYYHYIYDGNREILVDGIVWFEIQEWLFSRK